MSKNILHIAHFFCGLAGTCVNPGSIFQTVFLCIHLFNVCSTCHTIFGL